MPSRTSNEGAPRRAIAHCFSRRGRDRLHLQLRRNSRWLSRLPRLTVIAVSIFTMAATVAYGAIPTPTIPEARQASAIWEREVNQSCDRSRCATVYTDELSRLIRCSKQNGWDRCVAPHCEREENGWCRKEPQKFGEASNEGESVDILRVWFHRHLCDLGVHCFKMIDVEKLGQKVVKITNEAPEQPSAPLPEPGNPTGS